MKRLLLLTLAAVIGASHLYGQDGQSNPRITPVVTPSSPQSQIFERYVNHAITEYNGLPEISIPLYTIRLRGMDIPIVLSYHAGGVKWMQYDGDVAAGWSVNAGGFRISRTMYGIPDERAENSYNERTLNAIIDRTRSADRTVIELANQELDKWSGQYRFSGKDTGRDLFTYITPRSSGNFVYESIYSYYARVLGNNRDRVYWLISGSPFQITDESGFVYTYGDEPEYCESIINSREMSNLYWINAWTLKNIASPHGEQLAELYYTSCTPKYQTRQETGRLSIKDAASGLDACMDIAYQQEYITPEMGSYSEPQKMLFIDRIVTDREIVYFHRIDTSVPFYGNCISRITVEALDGSYRRNISFEYGTLPETVTNPEVDIWHRTLKSVTITEGRDSEKVYSFDYYGAYGGTSADKWGYYSNSRNWRGAENKRINLDESLSDFSFRRKNNSYNYIEIAILKDDRATKSYLCNREGNDAVKCFSLKTITFPTGGTTTYEYEPNRFFNSRGEMEIGGGQRVSRIISRKSATDPVPVTTQFKYGEDENGVGNTNFDGVGIGGNVFSTETLHFSERMSEGTVYRVDPMWQSFFIRSFSTQFNVPELNDFRVQYPKVTVYRLDAGQQTEGKVSSYYSTPAKYRLGVLNFEGFASGSNVNIARPYVDLYRIGVTPQLLKREYYAAGGSAPLQEEVYDYSQAPNLRSDIKGINLQKTLFIHGSKYYGDKHIYKYGRLLYSHNTYRMRDSVGLLTSSTIKKYGQVGEAPVVTETRYEYDSKYRVTKTTVTTSTGGQTVKYLRYPAARTLLETKNILSRVVSSGVRDNGILRDSVEYVYPATAIDPSSALTYSSDGSPRTDITYDLYDSGGNIRQYTDAAGVSTVVLWSYKWAHPVAEIVNATFSEVSAALSSLGLDADTLAQERNPYTSVFIPLRSLRTLLPAGMVSVFKYEPLVGVTEMTDPSGRTTYYKYDTAGRLVEVRDADNKVVEKYEYHYAGQ